MAAVNRWDFLLSEPEKERFARSDELIEDKSLSTRILSPFWEAVALLIPLSVAPNVISLAGLLCTIQAFYLCYSYMASNPILVTVASAALVFAYQTLDALDGIQARRTANASPVGALWDHACDNVSIVFVSLVGCYVVGITDTITMWYVAQLFSLMLLLVHLDALPKGRLSFGVLTGPGEAIFIFQATLLSYAFFGHSYLQAFWSSLTSLSSVRFLLTPANFYYAAVLVVLWYALRLPAKHIDTRRGVLFCMLFRIAPAVLYYLGWVRSESMLNVICDGLFVSVITTDLAVARMAQRPLHAWVWLFAMASVISYLAIVGIVVAYYFILFFELTTYMKLPMFTMLINVYVDGVYDLCLAEDHQILTSQGFLSHAQLVAAYNCDPSSVLIASYHPDSRSLVYEQASKVVVNPAGSSPYMVRFESGPLSLMVTPEHHMFVRREGSSSFAKVEAARLLGHDAAFLASAEAGFGDDNDDDNEDSVDESLLEVCGYVMLHQSADSSDEFVARRLRGASVVAARSVNVFRLGKRAVRAVFRGLDPRGQGEVMTGDSCERRDAVVRLAMHGGFATRSSFLDGCWRVAYGESGAVAMSASDTLLVTKYEGATWCVRVASGLIVTRRASEKHVSTPTIVGNCHVGHHNIFMAALQHGNRLFVGVLSDEAVAAYKRRPVMTMAERAAVVATCKGVFKVIPNAPCPGIPLEFLKKHNIHIVCLSTEYDKPDDIYYAVPRQLGITRVLPRTEGVSTSELIERVKQYGSASKQKF